MGLQSGAKRLQIGAGITKWGKGITNRGRDYKVGQGLQSGAAHQLQNVIIQGKFEKVVYFEILNSKFSRGLIFANRLFSKISRGLIFANGARFAKINPREN